VSSSKLSAAARRKLVNIGLPVAGFLLALGYGVAVARMSFGPPLVVLALGGMTLVLTALALYRTLDPLLRPEGEPGSTAARQAPARLRELEREKQMVLKAIREIEHDYQMRKIAESDYKEMVQRYRVRAMRIIRELDAGENYRVLIEQELKTRMEAVAAAEKEKPGETSGGAVSS
jgi:hypothetical protein